jgi:poly(beta-D-mannuronate) lyase
VSSTAAAVLLALAQEIDLGPWKLTLPTGAPQEIQDPSGFSSEHFQRSPHGLRFRAPVEGATTRGSSYPRCELRERDAAWSTTRGTHVLTIRQAITRTPTRKPHVVAGQIHDARDDVVMVRLEGRRLFVEGRGKDLGVLHPDYLLGTFFTVRIEASGGRIRVDFDGARKVDVERAAEGCYFKAGVYPQSNPSQGDAAGDYGEVLVRSLSIEHR